MPRFDRSGGKKNNGGNVASDESELPSYRDWAERNGEGPAGLDWIGSFELTEEDMREISDPNWIEPGLVPAEHIVVIVAPPNAGKTTILFHLSHQWARNGWQVVYVHGDSNPPEAKDKSGVRYLSPHMMLGKSMRDVIAHLEQQTDSGSDLHGWVFVFDTWKKVTDTMRKNAGKEIMELMRSLTAQGASIVILHHPNKHRDADGQWKYEGTNEIETEPDELIYFNADPDDASQIVSTVCEPGRGKSRAALIMRSYRIDADRKVVQLREYVNTQQRRIEREKYEKDGDVIGLILDLIEKTPAPGPTQSDIVKACNEEFGTNRKKTLRVLEEWDGKKWVFTTQQNAKRYQRWPK
jgi:hypothetical protein